MVLKPSVMRLTAGLAVALKTESRRPMRHAMNENRYKPLVNDLSFLLAIPFLSCGTASIPGSLFLVVSLVPHPTHSYCCGSGAAEYLRTVHRRPTFRGCEPFSDRPLPPPGVQEGIRALLFTCALSLLESPSRLDADAARFAYASDKDLVKRH